MSGSRKHGAPDRYNRAEVATRGLACPFANSDRMSTDVCKPTEGFKEPRLLLYVQTKPTPSAGHNTTLYHCTAG